MSLAVQATIHFRERCTAGFRLRLGRRGVVELFEAGERRFRQLGLQVHVLLWLPLVFPFLFAFVPRLRAAGAPVLFVSIGLGIVIGITEEVLWRGLYVRLFPEDLWANTVYPSIAFGLWHLCPLSVQLPPGVTYELSLAKLFIDQALPSAGIGSTIVVAKALERRAVPRAVVAAGMVINIASYHAAYVVCLGIALAITMSRGEARLPVLLVSGLFLAFSIAVTAALLFLPGRDEDRVTAKLGRFTAMRNALVFLKDADPHLTRHSQLLVEATIWQAVIFLLDAASMWVLILSLGTTAAPGAVFASFMIASVFRTVGIVPGGLGTFEATSVWTLRTMGISVPIGLAATLLFRGLSFWLPMLPGWWVTRRFSAVSVATAKPEGPRE